MSEFWFYVNYISDIINLNNSVQYMNHIWFKIIDNHVAIVFRFRIRILRNINSNHHRSFWNTIFYSVYYYTLLPQLWLQCSQCYSQLFVISCFLFQVKFWQILNIFAHIFSYITHKVIFLAENEFHRLHMIVTHYIATTTAVVKYNNILNKKLSF